VIPAREMLSGGLGALVGALGGEGEAARGGGSGKGHSHQPPC